MTEQEVMNLNIDKSLNKREGTYRKPRGVLDYEFAWAFGPVPTYGGAILHAGLKAFSAVFKWEGVPEEIDTSVMMYNAVQSGRMKMIKVGNKHYVVHIVPKEFEYQGNFKRSEIIEPYLPGISGKSAEQFKNVEMKINVTGTSLIRDVYPFIKVIDDALFNLDTNQSGITGKYAYLVDENDNRVDSTEFEDAINQWFLDGKPIKVMKKTMLDKDGVLPLIRLESYDATQSLIATVGKMESELLNVWGIPNNNAEGKRERMIVSEITIQNVLQSAILEDMLNNLKKFVEEANEVFGLSMSVELRDDILGVDETDVAEDDGGENDVMED